MTKRDFILCAPLQLVNHSNGVLAIVQLALSLEKAGRRAYLCVNSMHNDKEVVLNVDFDTYVPQNENEKRFVDAIRQAQQKFGFQMLRDFSQQHIDTCYVVYPEIIHTNPLNAKRAIRYFLNKDGGLSGRKVGVGPNDFILAQSRVMYPEAHFVAYFAAVNPLFHSEGMYPTEQRKLDLLYIGKGAQYGLNVTLPDTVTITRTWPETKEQLALLLRNCRIFYTGDACSSTNLEALFCGAIPAFIHNGPWSDAEIDGSELGAFPRLRAGMSRTDNFFAEFEAERNRYIGRIRTFQTGWDARVAQFAEKVDAHFSTR